MINRRLLRIKVVQIIYAFLKGGGTDLNTAERELFFSIGKSYELYHYLLLLLLEMQKAARRRIEHGRQKHIPTPEELNPNMRFVENELLAKLSNNNKFLTYKNNHKISWSNYSDIPTKLFNQLAETDYYKEYMSSNKPGFANDKQIVMQIFEELLPDNELLYHVLEEQSVYWNDDVEYVINMLLRTLKDFTPQSNEFENLMPLFKSKDDEMFARYLFRKILSHQDEHLELIKKFTINWDIDRVAVMDRIILRAALTEILEFETVPVKVSMNEYIEIAKFYSTRKSNVFINGILDKAVVYLRSENKILKTGVGLQE